MDPLHWTRALELRSGGFAGNWKLLCLTFNNSQQLLFQRNSFLRCLRLPQEQ